jgi:hypothetical protein
MIRELAMDSDFWTDTVWITDSTPVPRGTPSKGGLAWNNTEDGPLRASLSVSPSECSR